MADLQDKLYDIFQKVWGLGPRAWDMAEQCPHGKDGVFFTEDGSLYVRCSMCFEETLNELRASALAETLADWARV